jgi:hypothetical protein
MKMQTKHIEALNTIMMIKSERMKYARQAELMER